MEESEFVEPFERMLEELFPPQRVREIDGGDPGEHEWRQIEASGFLDAMRAEADGGAGLAFAQVLPLFHALGRRAVPLAVGEAILARAGERYAEEAANAKALLRAAQIAGAGARVLEMSVAYANERIQFGKPIGRQQAVQQQLAVMAEDVVAVRLATELAAARGRPDSACAAVAMSAAASAAARIANIAHAIHGAIGISAEYDLQLFTSRLHTWRVDGGGSTLWNRRLGERVLGSDEHALDWVREVVF